MRPSMLDRVHLSLWLRMAAACGLFALVLLPVLLAGALVATLFVGLFAWTFGTWGLSLVEGVLGAVGTSETVIDVATALVLGGYALVGLYLLVRLGRRVPDHARSFVDDLEATAAIRDIETTTVRDLGETIEIASGKVIDVTELEHRVARLAQQADVPPPDVEITRSWTPTAVTVGYRTADSTVVFSTGLLDAVEGDELDAVIAHELSHVKHRDTALMTGLSVATAMAGRIVAQLGVHVLIVAGLVALAVCKWCVAVVARCRERAADDGAVAITGDPAALASALESLDRELDIRPAADLRESDSAAALSILPPPWEERGRFDRLRRFVRRRLYGTHPSTEERIERVLEKY